MVNKTIALQVVLSIANLLILAIAGAITIYSYLYGGMPFVWGFLVGIAAVNLLYRIMKGRWLQITD